MTRQEAEQLRIGDIVLWRNDAMDLGDVVDVGYCCVKIRWRNEPEDRNVGLIHMNDLTHVEVLAQPVKR